MPLKLLNVWELYAKSTVTLRMCEKLACEILCSIFHAETCSLFKYTYFD